jgi:hypothetical protein
MIFNIHSLNHTSNVNLVITDIHKLRLVFEPSGCYIAG